MNTQLNKTGATRHSVGRFGVITALVAGGLAISGAGNTASQASPGAEVGPSAAGAHVRTSADGNKDRVRPRAARAATNIGCTGGATKKSFTGGYNDWTYTDSSSWRNVAGTKYRFKVPKGKDTVSVSVTMPEYWISSDDYGHYSVLLDGSHMQPGQAWTYADQGASGSASQFCKRVGRGWHTVQLVHRVYDSNGDGSAYSYLYKPMLHAEVNN